MMFTPCVSNCTKEGTHCDGCGRSHAEIAETRELINAIAGFMAKMEYENPEQFLQTLSAKALKTLRRNQCS